MLKKGLVVLAALSIPLVSTMMVARKQCDFIGTEFENGGTGGRKLSLKDVFERIVNHNRRLSNDDRFSTAPLAQAHLSVQICPKYEIYGHTRYHRDEVRRFPLGRS